MLFLTLKQHNPVPLKLRWRSPRACLEGTLETEEPDYRATAEETKSSTADLLMWTLLQLKEVWEAKWSLCLISERRIGVTSVPWRLVACVAKVFIFSLYSCAARLLYLALAALAWHPCWLKNAICHKNKRSNRKRFALTSFVTCSLTITNWQHLDVWPDTHRTGIAPNLHASKLEPWPIEVQLSGPEEQNSHVYRCWTRANCTSGWWIKILKEPTTTGKILNCNHFSFYRNSMNGLFKVVGTHKKKKKKNMTSNLKSAKEYCFVWPWAIYSEATASLWENCV